MNMKKTKTAKKWIFKRPCAFVGMNLTLSKTLWKISVTFTCLCMPSTCSSFNKKEDYIQCCWSHKWTSHGCYYKRLMTKMDKVVTHTFNNETLFWTPCHFVILFVFLQFNYIMCLWIDKYLLKEILDEFDFVKLIYLKLSLKWSFFFQ